MPLNLFKNNKDNNAIINIDDSEVDSFLHTSNKQKLLNLFNEVNIQHPIGYVLEVTGIKNITTLKSMITRLRKEGVVLKTKFGDLKRTQ